jgi:hypothetical protein
VAVDRIAGAVGGAGGPGADRSWGVFGGGTGAGARVLALRLTGYLLQKIVFCGAHRPPSLMPT